MKLVKCFYKVIMTRNENEMNYKFDGARFKSLNIYVSSSEECHCDGSCGSQACGDELCTHGGFWHCWSGWLSWSVQWEASGVPSDTLDGERDVLAGGQCCCCSNVRED
jgi:hypothetical protein